MPDFKLRSAILEREDDYEAIYEEYYRRGWTDGLPIVPPTEERVSRMIDASGRKPEEIIGEFPPKRSLGTIENLAVNAVMAGCLPAYFPVVVAVAEVLVDPLFDLFSVNTTTNAVAVMSIINGPIRKELDVNCSYGVLGPGWRANATIGRAVRLIQLNVAGAVPGPVSKSTEGQPGRYGMCIGEFEERSPWEPLHVEHGFAADASTVTVMQAQGTIPITESLQDVKTGKDLLHVIAHCMDGAAPTNMLPGHRGDSLLMLCPDHAVLLKQHGYSKQAVKEYLYELTCQIPIDRWPAVKHPTLRRDEWRVKGDKVALHQKPEHLQVVVSGGLGGIHNTWIPTYSHSPALTRLINRP